MAVPPYTALPIAPDYHVHTWTAADVTAFFQANSQAFDLDSSAIEKIRAVGIPGQQFANLTADALEDMGVPSPLAHKLVVLMQYVAKPKDGCRGTKRKLKDFREKLTQEQRALMDRLSIVYGEKDKHLTEEVLIDNGIKLRMLGGPSLLESSIPSWPSHVKEFYNRLVAKLKYTENQEDILVHSNVVMMKTQLGPEFTDHFVEAPGGIEVLQLLSLSVALQLLEHGFFCYMGQSDAGKEASLTSNVVDIALRVYGTAFIRNKQHTKIPIKNQDYLWTPLSDFQVVYGNAKRGDGYAILHGETESKGQTEEQAMWKMALQSLHSWKVIHELTGKSQVILSVYVSKQICSMYMFFQGDEPDERYHMDCILYMNDMFHTRKKSDVVEFVKRLYNFASIAEQPTLHADFSSIDEIFALLGTHHSTAFQSRTSTSTPYTTPHLTEGTKPVREGINPSDVEAAGLEVIKALKNPNVAIVRRTRCSTCSSHCCHVAKRTKRNREYRIIKLLSAATSAKFRNHTIAIQEVVLPNNDDAIIIMPYHTSLAELSKMDPLAYNNLRFQLIEGVAFLHEQGIVHLDLKPQNVVVEFDDVPHGRLSIIDYDTAGESERLRSGYRGTKGWTAPEVSQEGGWDPKPADVWAMVKVIRYLGQLIPGSYEDKDIDLVGIINSVPSSRPKAEDLLKKLPVFF